MQGFPLCVVDWANGACCWAHPDPKRGWVCTGFRWISYPPRWGGEAIRLGGGGQACACYNFVPGWPGQTSGLNGRLRWLVGGSLSPGPRRELNMLLL